MTKGEQTRRKIVEAAAPIFNKRGYEGSSLSDLMEATGLKKGASTVTSLVKRKSSSSSSPTW